MSFNLYVQQNQWIVVALLAGSALMLLLCLAFRAMWRPRREEIKEESHRIAGVEDFFRWLLTFMPWALILVIIGSAIYTITHVLAAVSHLPNW